MLCVTNSGACIAKSQIILLVKIITNYNEFDLTISNDRNVSTTRYKTTIDAVFTRYINSVQSKFFVLFYSYHKPIVFVLKFYEYNDERVNEITDEN